jgi:hypothetical protein
MNDLVQRHGQYVANEQDAEERSRLRATFQRELRQKGVELRLAASELNAFEKQAAQAETDFTRFDELSNPAD